MSILEAVVIGITQGLTEFIPVSSTAHVRVVPALLGWDDPGAAFTAVIQIGTLLAAVFYFREDLQRAWRGWFESIMFRGKANSEEGKFGWAVFWGTIPVSVAGLALKDYIEGPFRSLYVIVSALIGLALLLALSEKVGSHQRMISSVRPFDGFFVGLFQALSLVPGVSRSGSTITGALFLGFSREVAARFSFVLSIPAIVVSGVYELYSERDKLVGEQFFPLILCTLVSLVVGYLSIDFLLKFLRKKSTAIFIYYRIALGLLLLWLLHKGMLHPMTGISDF
jgi:undecaprenyl-diphosphatase